MFGWSKEEKLIEKYTNGGNKSNVNNKWNKKTEMLWYTLLNDPSQVLKNLHYKNKEIKQIIRRRKTARKFNNPPQNINGQIYGVNAQVGWNRRSMHTMPYSDMYRAN